MSVFLGGTAARLLPTEGATALRAPRESSEGRPLLQAVPDLPRSRKTPRSTGEAPPSASDTTKRYARLVEAFAMTTEAEVAYSDLDHALLLTRERGQKVPCLGPGGEAWTSDDYDDQQIAADRCWDCPALFLCQQYAQAAGEKAGTWGGETRNPALGPDEFPRTAERTPSRSSKARDCSCGCEGQTKGGRYLPGHDSKHLQRLAAVVSAGGLSIDRAMDALAESPNLRAKLLRQVGR